MKIDRKNLATGLQVITSPQSRVPQKNEIKDTFNLNSGSSDKGDYLIIPKKSAMRSAMSRVDSMSLTERDLKKENIQTEKKLEIVSGYTAKLNQEQKEKLEKSGYIVYEDKVERWIPEPNLEEALDNTEKQFLDQAIPSISKEGSPVNNEVDPIFQKYTGKGVGIAIIDTGVYPHSDFITPRNRIVGWHDAVDGRTQPYDDGGHGTHVAGDAAGSGAASEGKFKSFAPDADIVGIKVLGRSGGKTSDVLEGIEWAIKNKERYNIKVINMSLGHKAFNYLEDPTDIAVQQAFDAGITVVVAAGNDGPEEKTVAAPGDSPFAITVGAVDDKNTPDRSDDTLTPFSSCGPTPDGLIKPDIVAPGESIIAPLAPGSKAEEDGKFMENRLHNYKWMATLPYESLNAMPDEVLKNLGLRENHIEEIRKSPEDAEKMIKQRIAIFSRMPLVLGTSYMGMPGTSMATPIVAGVVAAMYEANPELTPAQVKEILMSTADKMEGLSENQQGAGYIDAKEALHKAEQMRLNALKNKEGEV